MCAAQYWHFILNSQFNVQIDSTFFSCVASVGLELFNFLTLLPFREAMASLTLISYNSIHIHKNSHNVHEHKCLWVGLWEIEPATFRCKGSVTANEPRKLKKYYESRSK